MFLESYYSDWTGRGEAAEESHDQVKDRGVKGGKREIKNILSSPANTIGRKMKFPANPLASLPLSSKQFHAITCEMDYHKKPASWACEISRKAIPSACSE